MNLIDACIDKKIKRVVALSTDKASAQSIYIMLQIGVRSCLFLLMLTLANMDHCFQLLDMEMLWDHVGLLSHFSLDQRHWRTSYYRSTNDSVYDNT